MNRFVELGQLIEPALVKRAGTSEYPILSMTMRHGLVDQADKFKKRIASADTSSYKVVSRGQLVVGFPIDEGVLSIQDLHSYGIVSPAYDIWDVHDGIDRRYLERFLRSPRALSYYRAKLQGSTARRRNLTRGDFLALPVPTPPTARQKRIVAVLDRVDELRAKRRQSIALLDDLAQSIFLDMFGEPSAGGTHVPVAELAEASAGSVRTGPFGSQLLHEEFADAGIPVLGIDNTVDNEFVWGKPRFITEEKYRQLSRYTVHPGDVVITIMGTLGRCVVVPDDIPVAINTKHLCCITLDRELCLPEYLHSYFLLHPDAQRYLTGSAKGAIMAGLNMGIIKKMPVHVPPIARQKEFRTRIRKVRALKDAHITDLAQLDVLFSSLQSRAFAGDLWKDDLNRQEGE